MEKLTAQQAKMVLEYFAQQAAEDAPTLALEFHKHLWLTLYTASIAIERQINKQDWDELVTALIAYQSFDRDKAAFLSEQGLGEADNTACQDDVEVYLKTQVSWSIDNCFNNSGA